ncbi:gamma-2-syntrophin-like [Halichondria panicea]|uniref:gamma-2-syntrophin-like n=1 Tax=Halichondria panicea TaxID=6063 RepID=UPI00312B5256
MTTILFAQPTKTSQLEPVMVQLAGDRLVVSQHDMVHEDILANNEIYDDRVITLERGENGLGFSIQGGTDFKCPIKIYKIFEGSPAENSGLDERDVIFEVNRISMWGKTHEEAAHIIRTTGDEVQLHVGKLRDIDIDDPQRYNDQWLIMADVPLKMASVTRYQHGTAIPKPNQIQVTSKNGRSKVTLHCHEDSSQQLSECSKQIEQIISELTRLEMDNYNTDATANDQVLLMGWVTEHLPSAANTKVWQRKFLVLRNFQLQIYNTPPEEISEWERPEKSYKLLEMSVQVLQPHSFQDQRANSIVITTGHGTNHIISFEKQNSLQQWTRQIHDSTVKAVLSIERQSFIAEWRDQYVYFLLDIQKGFAICSRDNLANCLWTKPFSALRRSSDDGHSRLRLEFAALDSQITEVQEIELEDMQIAVCCMECFLAAKVATLDPNFISRLDIIA